MDDKIRLLGSRQKNDQTQKSGQISTSVYKSTDISQPDYVYGALDRSEDADPASEQPNESLTKVSELPPALPKLHPRSAVSPQDAPLASPQSPPSPELTARSSSAGASPADPSSTSSVNSQKNASADNVLSTTQPRTTTTSLGSSDDKSSNDKNHSSSSRTLPEQHTKSIPGADQQSTLENSRRSNSHSEHQGSNIGGADNLETSLGLHDFTGDITKPIPAQYPRHLKDQLTKPHNTSSEVRNQTTHSSDTGQSDDERRRLFNPSNMEMNGYSNDRRKTTDEDSNSKDAPEEKTPFFVYYLACFATIGGLLFGYDTGIVSGSMLLIKDYFSLSTIWQEVIVSGTVGAAAVFSLFAGFSCDFFGRKITIMAASVVFVIGAIIMAVSESKEVLLAGRIVVGIGIGFASMTVPVYVAEASPPAIRGRLVTLNQLFITIGILISSVIAGAFSNMKEDGWRYMLGLAAVPGIIQFIGFFFLPESPRWLVMKGKDDRAEKVLQRIRGKTNVTIEINEIKEAVEEDKKQEGFVLGRVIKTQHVRRALFVGSGLQVFQQLCGINTVIYYSATILKMAGFPSEAAIWLVLVPNGINFLATFIGVVLVERLGRKKLIVISFVGVVTALAVLAIGFQLSANFSPSLNHNVTEVNGTGSELVDGCFEKNYDNCQTCIEDTDCGFCYTGSGALGSCLRVQEKEEDTLSRDGRCQNETWKSASDLTFSHGYCPTDYTWMAVLGLALFVLAFAPGLGPMPWTINSEIYPMWARSTCNSIATGCNWICNLLVSLFFLTLTETITKYGAFWLFGGICFVGMLFTIVFLPETKNKTLEQVEELFMAKKSRGADNLGYEKEMAPADNGKNTRL